jgi:hypothetical protein
VKGAENGVCRPFGRCRYATSVGALSY